MTGNLKNTILALTLLTALCIWPGAIAKAQGKAAEAAGAANPDTSGAQLPANHGQAADKKIYTGEKISLDFQNADIHTILRIIGEVSGKNIILSDSVTGKITIKIKDMPWDQALDIVLSSKNLGLEESGNTMTVYDLPTSKNKRLTRKLVNNGCYHGGPLPLQRKVFTLKYTPISKMSAELEKYKSKRGKVVAIGNDIYVEDEPSVITAIGDAFTKFEIYRSQVLIEARIIDCTVDFCKRLADDKQSLITKLGSLPASCTTSDDRNSWQADSALGFGDPASLRFGILNKAQSLVLPAEINASETDRECKSLSVPRVMAANDQEINIKQSQPFGYRSVSSVDTPANNSFKDAIDDAMELKVKPHIADSGDAVTLDIRLINTAPQAGEKVELAVTDHEAQARVMIKNGETVFINGINFDSNGGGASRQDESFRLPLLKWLRQSADGIPSSKSERLIFITATIVPIEK